jgi:hypothetical protein
MPFSYNPLLGVGLDKSIPLDGAGKIPSTFLPSYVDDVEEYSNLAAFPATGETGKIYVAIDTGFVYRWSGSVYVQIGITAAAGATTQVQFNDAGAFGGDAGLTYDKSTDALTSGSLSVTSAGAAATPSLTFTGDPNTGIFSPGADQLAISTGGTARLTSSTTALTSALPVDVPLGAAATPSLTFTGDLNTGIYSPGADQLAVATNGTGRLFVDSSGRVGVGTASPTSPLHVQSAGTVALFGDSIGNNTLAVTRITTGPSYIALSATTNAGKILAGPTLTLNTTAADGTSVVERLRITSAGLVGIGSSAPQENLHLKGAGATSLRLETGNGVSFVSLRQNQTGNYFEISPSAASAQSLVVNRPGGSEALRVDSNGRLLVGTSSSSDNVRAVFTGNSLSATDGGVVHLRRGGSAVSVNTHIGTLGFAGGEGLYASIITQADATPGTGDSPGRLVFSTTADGASSPTERMRIDSSGRLLVGTTSARTNVFTIAPRIQYEGSGAAENRFVSFGYSSADAAGPGIAIFKTRAASAGGNTAVVDADMLGELRFCGADGTNIIRGAAIGAFVDGTPSANDMPGRLVFSTTADGATTPTERMRIKSNGNVLVTQSSASVDGFKSNCTDGSFTGSAITASTTRAAGTSCLLFYGTANAAQSILIYNNGNVQNTNNSYGAISDIKLKENIVDASSQWNDLKALQVRNYNFKEGQTHTQIGLVAQEVELVSPGLVSESPDRDEDGNDIGTVTKSVNYSVLYMKAVKALQEAMERIEQLEAKVAALETK